MSNWLEIARNQAEERYRSLPDPTSKDENFRFTKLEMPAAAAGGAAPEPGSAPAELRSLGEEELALLSLRGEDAAVAGSVPGALFTDLLRATVLGSEALRARLKDGALFSEDKFAQLTQARWQNGAFFHLPAGTRLEKPVRVAYAPAGSEEHQRNLILLEDGAEAVFVQETLGGDGDRFLTELTEVRLGKGAKLHWVVLQRLGEGSKAVVRQRIELGQGAELKVTPVHLGGALVQVRQEARLAEGAFLELEGAARGDGTQHFDFWLDADHWGSRSRSEMNFRFVMGDSSRAVFNGLLQIRQSAIDCQASQKSKSLLLGAKATVHAIPKLIIQTDAVKCSHGASVSSVNPEQVHYLQSRGISRPEAERMIVRGFTEMVFERLPGEALHGRAEAALDRKRGGWLQ